MVNCHKLKMNPSYQSDILDQYAGLIGDNFITDPAEVNHIKITAINTGTVLFDSNVELNNQCEWCLNGYVESDHRLVYWPKPRDNIKECELVLVTNKNFKIEVGSLNFLDRNAKSKITEYKFQAFKTDIQDGMYKLEFTKRMEKL